jgi:hypothetical protein
LVLGGQPFQATLTQLLVRAAHRHGVIPIILYGSQRQASFEEYILLKTLLAKPST